MKDRRAPEAWFRDRAALAPIGTRYLPWLTALNLGWEIVQLPLYTIWHHPSVGYVAYAVLHCTAGDVLIGLAALVVALVATRAGTIEQWNYAAVACVLIGVSVSYTAYSEWMNTVLRASWTYSALMPTIRIAGVELGLSPLLQWVVVPPVALWLTRRSHRQPEIT